MRYCSRAEVKDGDGVAPQRHVYDHLLCHQHAMPMLARIGCEHQEHIAAKLTPSGAGYGADLDGIAGGQHRGIISGKRVLFLHYGERAFPVSAAGEHDSPVLNPIVMLPLLLMGYSSIALSAGDADSDGVFGRVSIWYCFKKLHCASGSESLIFRCCATGGLFVLHFPERNHQPNQLDGGHDTVGHHRRHGGDSHLRRRLADQPVLHGVIHVNLRRIYAANQPLAARGEGDEQLTRLFTESGVFDSCCWRWF